MIAGHRFSCWKIERCLQISGVIVQRNIVYGWLAMVSLTIR